MAEAIGIFASGIGIAAFALQIGKASVELKRLCSEIKDAQKNVDILAEEVQLFAGLLAEIGRVMAPSESLIFAQCLGSCEYLNLKLVQLVNDFEHDLRKSKIRGGISVLRKKQKIKSLKEALERAKSSLSLAFLSTIRSTSAHNTRDIRTLIETGYEAQYTLTESEAVPIFAREDLSNLAAETASAAQSTNGELENQLTIRRKQSEARGKQGGFDGFAFKTPTWWLGSVYIFTKRQTFSGWDFTFRTYTAVPYSSPVFRYASDGNARGLQDLFQSKQASPFSVDEYGWTPLYYAVRCHQVDCVRLLLAMGADVNFANCQKFTIAEQAWFDRSEVRGSDPNRKSASDVRLLLLNHPDFESVHPWVMRQYLPNCKEGFIEYLALQSAFQLAVDPEDETSSRLVSTVYSAENVDAFWFALGVKTLDRSHLECPWFGPSLMRQIAFHVTRYHWASDRCRPQERSEWRSILKQSVQANAHVLFLQRQKSLSVGVIRHSLRDWNDSLAALVTNATNILRAWVTELQIAGADLIEYGQLERALLIEDAHQTYEAKNWTWSEIPTIWRTRCRVINFTYGPAISDWAIWLSWPLDEWAGEFWTLIDNPELYNVPGSWLDHRERLVPEEKEYMESRGYLSTTIGIIYPSIWE